MLHPTFFPDGTDGTATIILTRKQMKSNHYGCVIPNNEDLKNFLNLSGEEKKHKFFIYFCCFEKDLLDHPSEYEIRIHRFTKPTKDKVCTQGNEKIIVKDCHVFVPAIDPILNTRYFLGFVEKHGKKLINCKYKIQSDLPSDRYKGTEIEDGLVKVFKMSLTSNTGRLVLRDELFRKLLDGPLLYNDQVVGCCNKDPDGCSYSTVHILDTQEPTYIWKKSFIENNNPAINQPGPSGIIRLQVPQGNQPGPSGINHPPTTVDLTPGEHLVTFLNVYYSRGEWSLILPFPWMGGDRFHIDKQYTPLTITEKGHPNRNIDMKHLFSLSKDRPNTTVRRVLIEGESGMGKSTFCKKIAYDWSKDELQIPDVDLVLVIKCCDLKEGDLWQAIKEQNLPEELQGAEKFKEVCDYIRYNQEKVLLIVDGFDEIPATVDITKKNSIKDLVTGKLLFKARVVLTSRPERCTDIRNGFDKTLQMTGFSWLNCREFIQKFGVPSHIADETIANVRNTATLKELTRCPLNAAFFCLVVEEKGSDATFLKSLDIGSLYSEVVFRMLKWYCVEKLNRREVQDNTLMDEYHGVLVLLREIAFNLMKENLPYVPEGNLPANDKQILRDIGFLVESKASNKTSPTTTYKFTNSSIKEYFAALYVADFLTKGNIDILISIQMSQENQSPPHSNHGQNIYYSLQRFNLPQLANLPSSEEYIKLINGLAAQLPKNIDLSQAELTRFDFIFSLICEFLGNCKGDQATKVLKEIEIPDLPVVFYLYNGRQALDGLFSLLSQSKDETSKVKIKILRVEGLQVIELEDFVQLSKVLGECRLLRTLYLSFISYSKLMLLFFKNFQTTSLEHLGLRYIPEGSSNENIATILSKLCILSSLDLSNSSLSNDPCFYDGVCQLIENDTLKVLKLCHCNLRSRDVVCLTCHLYRNTTLIELDLSGNDLSGLDFFHLEDSALQVLRMSGCNLGSPDVVRHLIGCLRQNTTLIELDLSGNDLSGHDFFHRKVSALQVPRMSGCNLGSPDVVRHLIWSLRRITTLRELDLSGNAIEVEKQTSLKDLCPGVNIKF